ncbi:RdgB/HAM1 family non-canonical purine NTP pyrophosphatase [Aurantibacillus circumpalustris]|uniref:RdgB/HAM1 family non-canonical purine NTP pyrophosphatase n=1 Tax=Aurantibacillus circumpalustris TaxID=3036359 RepID=UPI00295A6446|nr:RdgB/HAM1 family non-canonical purine NTP pyrophosphatase [Aurantibacillus circumpalustris]
MELLFASSNKNKIKEIAALLPKDYVLSGLQDVGVFEEIPETGQTIKDNSLLKAQYVVSFLKNKNTAMAVFADDSGLEVEALNNAPGVYSARYAGVPKSDESNNKKLLTELKGVSNRNARFVTVITLILNDTIHYFEGEVKGAIGPKPSGYNGFGYDPLFIPEGYSNTFADLSPEIKNSISHRSIAVKKLIRFLEQQAQR